jgi:hypothetical protein
MNVAAGTQGIRTWGEEPDGGRSEPAAGPPVDANAAARAERAAADARFQALAAGGAPDDPCDNFAAPDHDFDRCVTDFVTDPVLFHQQISDANAVDAKDVRQGHLADCDLLAPLAALANTPQGRAFIRSAIVEHKNCQGDVVSYTVTLHRAEHHLFGATTYRDVPVTVAPPFAVGHAFPQVEDGTKEIWPLIVEKACAQYAGGYNGIGRGGVVADAMTLLTGREARCVSFNWPSRVFNGYGAGELQADLANGNAVVLCTRRGIGGTPGRSGTPTTANQAALNPYGLADYHAYYALAIEQHDGKTCVRLGNPWPGAESKLIPCDELPRWFSGVTIGSVP